MDNPDITITENVPLAPLTAWRIGGPARYLASVRSPRGVQAALEFADSRHLPVWVLGGGSNMLISDAGLAGVVIRMRDMRVDVTNQADYALVAIGAGAPMAGTVRQLGGGGADSARARAPRGRAFPASPPSFIARALRRPSGRP